AQIVTRTLETRRERIIATILLALAIPCSAQLGVIFALLAGHPAGLAFWIVFVSGTFLVAGWLAARLMPGEKPSFYMELPPLRWPRPANVLLKTYTRVVWYFKEVFPLFVLASLFIWIGQITGGFQWLVQRIEPAMGWLGLPKQAAVAFLFGFFRRDYGAAGLYDLRDQGLLTGNQLVVAAITLTLFLPCVAQFLVVQKERGWRWAAGLSLGILVTALAVGVATNATFRLLGVAL
ncbi:MAG: nucleoside recognition domain-containing protein, partial [Terriglobales bacterium]